MTYMANEQNVVRSWYIVDAAGLPLGRVASQVAAVLRGKHKPTFTPHVDTGDFVIIINTDQIVLTGKKLDQKERFTHSLYPGGAKVTKYRKFMREHSDRAVYEAVQGMLPKGPLGRRMLKKLRVYKTAEHKHIAQQPQPLAIVVPTYAQKGE